MGNTMHTLLLSAVTIRISQFRRLWSSILKFTLSSSCFSFCSHLKTTELRY